MALKDDRITTGIIPSPWALSGATRAVILLAFLLLTASGCRTAIVRVPVSSEDIQRANAAANEGDVFFARKDYYAALIKYLEAAGLNPNNEYIYNKLGIAYSRLQLYEDATNAFIRSIGLNPKYPYSYNNLGSVYFALNNKKKAESYFRKAISLKNDDASFHINLGTLYFENKKFQKGMEEYRKGLSLDPEVLNKTGGLSVPATTSSKNSVEKYYSMARLYASLGNAELAVDNLRQALTNGFTDLEALRTERDFDMIRKDEKFIAFMKYAAQLIK